MSWADLAEWWLEEVAADPAYEKVVTPLLLDVLRPQAGAAYLDLGCGEGRVMRAVARSGARPHGLERSERLARRTGMPTMVGSLPGIPVRDGSYDGAYCVLTLEHLADHRALLAEAARVVRPGGSFALVVNHPMWTAPGSTPITDVDGEVLWRPGVYFSESSEEMRAGGGEVTFHHRSMASLLNAASDAGWALQQVVERPHHELVDQAGIPRLLAARWRLGSG